MRVGQGSLRGEAVGESLRREDFQLCYLETTCIRSERDPMKKTEPEIKQYVQLLIAKDATESKSVYAKCFGSYFWSKRESKF